MKIKKENYILSIETTSKICGVCISNYENIILYENINNGFTHSVTLFSCIDRLLKKCKIKASNLSKIKVSAGPGSFTGIRIGIAAALSIAKPHNIEIEYIDTLDSLNVPSFDLSEFSISLIDAKANRVYIAIYDKKGRKILKDAIYDVDILIDYLNKYFYNKNIIFTLSGDGYLAYKDKFKTKLKVKYINYDYLVQDSRFIALCNGHIDKRVRINYMLKSKAERDRNGKN